jgi:hypothetical protein
MMSKCALPGCFKAGISRCSICLSEPYCSGECQKGDWKLHKLICKTLKKLSLQLQPYQDVCRVIEEIVGERPKKVQLEMRVLGNLLFYAEHQFGDQVPGKVYRERLNGERVDNWVVELEICLIYKNLQNVYSRDESLSMIDSNNLRFPCLEKMLDLLSPWSSKLDSNSISQMDSIEKDRINFILHLLSATERTIGSILRQRNKFELSESYCQEALSHARLYEGTEEDKIDLLCSALTTIYYLTFIQDNFIDALPFAEEAYNLYAIAYNPVHPKVQKAAGMLIQCLMHKGDLYDAERFAEATLDSLKDPANRLDQESEEVAEGYHNLANVINTQDGDFVKAEMLARESLRIRTRLYSNDHINVGLVSSLLANILMSQDNMGDETMELLECSLANQTKHYGPDGTNVVISNFNLGTFYHRLADKQQIARRKIECLCLSISKFEEVVRIHTKIFGPDNPQTRKFSSELYIVLHKLYELEA